VEAEEFIRLRKKVRKKAKDEDADDVMQEAYDMLSCLLWSGDIHGFDHREPLYMLATYASREWLATTHENQILDLLRWDLLLRGSGAKIASMAFFDVICSTYDHRDTGEYDESRAFGWI
jgi:hypothetical protein